MSDLTPVQLPPPSGKLDYDTCTKIGGALNRLEELKTSKIATKKGETEAMQLVEFLSETLIKHAKELVGCWFVIKGEYEPLIRASVPLFQRLQANAKKQEESLE